MSPDKIEMWIRVWGLVLFATVVIGGYAGYKVTIDLPQKLRKAEVLVESEIAEQDPYYWPNWYLQKRPDWLEHPIDGPPSWRLFVEVPERPISEQRSTQVLLRDGEQTVLWAEKHVLGANYRWVFAEFGGKSPTPVQYGDDRVSVKKAVEGTHLAKIVRGADTGDQIDIIGIGLDSYPGADLDSKRKLSRRRGLDIAGAARTLIDPVARQGEISYRALGLGKAKTETIRGTAEEQNQRRLVVFVSARKKSVLTPAQAIKILILSVPHDDVDLNDYEYAPCADQILSGPIDFSGGGSTEWLEFGPAVDQVCADAEIK